MYITTFCILFIAWMLMKIKAFPIIKTSITSKYNRWKNLNSLVSTRYSNTFKIVCISIKMIAKSCYISFIQYINSSVTKIGPNSYELSYIINGKLYKMVVKTQRGPIPVIQVSNDKQDDITDKILPYMGPKYNWHGNVFTPEFFGCDLLIFEMSDGTEHAFDKDTYIIL